MVCHETYRDESGMWLSPEEVKKEGNKIINLKNKNSKVIIGPSEECLNQKKRD